MFFVDIIDSIVMVVDEASNRFAIGVSDSDAVKNLKCKNNHTYFFEDLRYSFQIPFFLELVGGKSLLEGMERFEKATNSMKAVLMGYLFPTADSNFRFHKMFELGALLRIFNVSNSEIFIDGLPYRGGEISGEIEFPILSTDKVYDKRQFEIRDERGNTKLNRSLLRKAMAQGNLKAFFELEKCLTEDFRVKVIYGYDYLEFNKCLLTMRCILPSENVGRLVNSEEGRRLIHTYILCRDAVKR